MSTTTKPRRHRDGRDGEQLADDDHVVHGVVAVEVRGDHHHHAARGEADGEGEVGDVEPPRDVVAHARHAHAVHDLLGPRVDAHEHHGGEHGHPDVEGPVAVGGAVEHLREEAGVGHLVTRGVHRGSHTSKK
jgi:hypothetical protein